MNVSAPHYELFSETGRTRDPGRWRFVLRANDGSEVFEASDVEPEARGERLDLLTVVRALESLDQPSLVTLVGCSPYVRQGMQYGLSEWRSNGWRWEFFGQLVPVKNGDLWQRLDRVLRYHRVDCLRRRLDPAHSVPVMAAAIRGETRREKGGKFGVRLWGHRGLRYCVSKAPADCRRRAAAPVWPWRGRVTQWWRALALRPSGWTGR